VHVTLFTVGAVQAAPAALVTFGYGLY